CTSTKRTTTRPSGRSTRRSGRNDPCPDLAAERRVAAEGAAVLHLPPGPSADPVQAGHVACALARPRVALGIPARDGADPAPVGVAVQIDAATDLSRRLLRRRYE